MFCSVLPAQLSTRTMLTRRRVRPGPVPYQYSMSPAQFQTTMGSHRNTSQPANRLVKPSLSPSVVYDRYEDTPRRTRQSEEVMFPPVHKSPARSPSSARRPAKNGNIIKECRDLVFNTPRHNTCSERHAQNAATRAYQENASTWTG